LKRAGRGVGGALRTTQRAPCGSGVRLQKGGGGCAARALRRPAYGTEEPCGAIVTLRSTVASAAPPRRASDTLEGGARAPAPATPATGWPTRWSGRLQRWTLGGGRAPTRSTVTHGVDAVVPPGPPLKGALDPLSGCCGPAKAPFQGGPGGTTAAAQRASCSENFRRRRRADKVPIIGTLSHDGTMTCGAPRGACARRAPTETALPAVSETALPAVSDTKLTTDAPCLSTAAHPKRGPSTTLTWLRT